MKRTLLYVATATICLATMLSCKNKTNELTQEQVQEQKLAVADSVLSLIDTLEIEFVNKSDNGFRVSDLFALTDAEKLVKPDYLLDPSAANTLFTRRQKINALAYYTLEYGIREAYGMPLDDVNKAITKLSVDVDVPIDLDYLRSDAAESLKVQRVYEMCREKGDIAAFWQYQCAFIFHTDYIIACNPKLYIPKISEEGLQQFNHRLEYVTNAATALAPYDKDMESLLLEIKSWDLLVDETEWDEAFASDISTAQFYIKNKKAIIERRNRMIEE